MSTELYGHNAAWPFADPPSDELAPWHQLQQLARRAGLSIEHLCQTVEEATGFDLETKAEHPFYNPDLEEVIRALADDDFDLKTKAAIERPEWREADHPRDGNGRFGFGGSRGQLNAELGGNKPPPIITTNTYQQVKGELNSIHEEIKNILGLNSRWSGRLLSQNQDEMDASGRKDPSCTITLAQQLFPNEKDGTDDSKVRRICTLIHESLHALAATTPQDYGRAVGWEEAVIDHVTRLYRSQVAQKLGFNIPQKELEKRDAGHPYHLLVKSIEEIRENLAKHGHQLAANPDAFYHKLMTIPASQKRAYIEGEAQRISTTLSAKEKRAFSLMLSRTTHVLSSYKHPHLKASDDVAAKSQTHAMTRDELVDMMLSTRTREEVIDTKQAIRAWMQNHPDDQGIMDGAEMIAMLAATYGIKSPKEEERERRQHILFDKLDANPGLNIDEELAEISKM